MTRDEAIESWNRVSADESWTNPHAHIENLIAAGDRLLAALSSLSRTLAERDAEIADRDERLAERDRACMQNLIVAVGHAERANQAERERDEARAALAERNAWLAECYKLTGADPDGNEDWRLAPRAVAEVKRLREEHDADSAALAAYEKAHAKARP